MKSVPGLGFTLDDSSFFPFQNARHSKDLISGSNNFQYMNTRTPVHLVKTVSVTPLQSAQITSGVSNQSQKTTLHETKKNP